MIPGITLIRRGHVQDKIGHTRQTSETAPVVQIRKDRTGTQGTQGSRLLRVPDHGQYPETRRQPGNGPARHITTADYQHSFHPANYLTHL